MVPEGGKWVLTCGNVVRWHGITVPGGGNGVPEAGKRVPAGGNVVTERKKLVPAGGHKVPTSGHKVPRDGNEVPSGGHAVLISSWWPKTCGDEVRRFGAATRREGNESSEKGY